MNGRVITTYTQRDASLDNTSLMNNPTKTRHSSRQLYLIIAASSIFTRKNNWMASRHNYQWRPTSFQPFTIYLLVIVKLVLHFYATVVHTHTPDPFWVSNKISYMVDRHESATPERTLLNLSA